MTGFWLVAFLVQWMLLIVLSVLIFGMLRYLQSIKSRIEVAVPRITRFELGDKVSDLTLPRLDGSSSSVSQMFHQGKNVLLLLLTTTCGSCEAIIMQLAELTRREGGLQAMGWSVALICYGQPGAVKQLVERVAHTEGITIHVDEQAVAARQFLVTSLPIGLALDEQGYVLSQSPNPGPNWLYLTMNIPAPDSSVLLAQPTAEIRFAGM